jgi:cytidylate kinase
MRKIVAISGLAASGKGTVSKGVAKLTGFKYYDIGLLFRFGTYLIQKGLVKDLSDVKEGDKFFYLGNGDKSKIIFNGNDITRELISSDISMKTAELASTKKGLKELSKFAEKVIPENENIVCDGRSAGITIFPNADLKFFTQASLETRIMRRYNDLIGEGYKTTLDQVTEDIKARDELDMKRRIIPRKNVIILDTEALPKGESAKIIASMIEKGGEKK